MRRDGVGGRRLVAYTSAAAHGCLPRAMEMAGLGRDALRMIPCDDQGRMRLDALADRVAEDRARGMRPFLLVGTAGTVDIGAVDDLAGAGRFRRGRRICGSTSTARSARSRRWRPKLRPLLAGIERADSVAFDFHKWAQVPYDAGCIVVRDASRQLDTFAAEAAYLRREQRGLAGGGVWPCDLGPDLSRGFRALKVWMTLSVYGADRIGAVAQQTCDLAATLAARVDREPALERLAPVALNIVCFRFIAAEGDLDRLNAEDRRRSAGGGDRRAVHHHRQRRAGDPGGDREPSDEPRRYRDPGGRGAGGRARSGRWRRAEKKVPPVIHRGQVYREASRLGDAGTRGPLPATGAGTLAAVPP